MADTPIDSRLPRSSGFPWRFLLTTGLIAFAIAVGAGLWMFYRITAPPYSVVLSREFKEYIPTVGPTDGILETATCSVPETFTQTDSASIFNIIPLGTTVAEIRVPAIYRYHVPLFDAWKFETRGGVCVVNAPAFQPSLPVAILTGQMEKSTAAGWLRFNGEESLETLEQGITGELNVRAKDKTHRDYVREACRQSVTEFVRRWLMKEDIWRQDQFHQIIVRFPDDPAETGVALSSTGDNLGH